MLLENFVVYHEDCLDTLKRIKDDSIALIITSPPYQTGKSYEKDMSFNEYLSWQKDVIQECYRVCCENGSICWQVGNYIGKDGSIRPLDCELYPIFKDLGMKCRNRIVWTFNHGLHCTKRFSGRHETILWFSKTDDYIFNLDPVRIPQKYPGKKYYKGPKKGQLSCNPLGKSPADVWDIPNVKHNHVEKTEHPCQFPVEIPSRLILALTNENDIVFDPFTGSGSTGIAAVMNNRKFVGCDTNENYTKLAEERISKALKGELAIRDFELEGENICS